MKQALGLTWLNLISKVSLCFQLGFLTNSYEEIAHLPTMVIHIGRLMVLASLAVDVNAEI